MKGSRHAVVGAGIVGLALARSLATRGAAVTVFEGDVVPQGASVRNFGTLWPIGQPAGPRRAMAMKSMAIWRDVLKDTRAWSAPDGSLHLAYYDDERALLAEFASSANTDGFRCELFNAAQTMRLGAPIRAQGLIASLWSAHELQINPRQISELLPQWLAERYGVQYQRGARVTSCAGGELIVGRRSLQFDHIWVAPGADTQTLYPEQLQSLGLRRCKLQMMRTAPVGWHGPVLAGGLTLTHYEAFAQCASLTALRNRLVHDWPMQTACGVHVLVSRHDEGQMVLGDSHEYDDAVTPFDKPAIDDLVIDYMRTFVDAPALRVVERWHGVYVKRAGAPYLVTSPEPSVTIVCGLGGHGMTLAFGLAEEVVGR